VLDVLGDVPVPHRRVRHLVQQDHDVPPGQLRSSLLRNSGRVGGGEGPHVDQIAGAQAPHPGELGTQVDREPVDDLGTPSLLLLSLQDELTYLPVHLDQRGIDHPSRPGPGRGDRDLDLRQQRPVPGPIDLRFHINAPRFAFHSGSQFRTAP